MKRIVLSITFVAFLATQGCASWISSFKANPMATVQSLEAGIATFLTTSDAIVSAILPLLGDKAAALDGDYEAAKAAVGHAESALNDAVQAAIDATQTSPDFSAAVTAVLAAADEVVSAVQAIQGAVQASAGVTPSASVSLTASNGSSDLKAERAHLERFRP
jgi:hypothetical protein